VAVLRDSGDRNNRGSPGLMAAEIIIEIISVDPYRGFLASMHD
jgi:hypothetical protein